jgi:hypothetical protein
VVGKKRGFDSPHPLIYLSESYAVLSILHYLRRGPDHLKLGADFL